LSFSWRRAVADQERENRELSERMDALRFGTAPDWRAIARRLHPPVDWVDLALRLAFGRPRKHRTVMTVRVLFSEVSDRAPIPMADHAFPRVLTDAERDVMRSRAITGANAFARDAWITMPGPSG
jgi:hypothetical protein